MVAVNLTINVKFIIKRIREHLVNLKEEFNPNNHRKILLCTIDKAII
jgi:hypothetical protein